MKIGFWTPDNKLVGTLTIDDKVKSTGLGRLFERYAFEHTSEEHGDGIEEIKFASENAWENNHLLVEKMAKLANVTVKMEARDDRRGARNSRREAQRTCERSRVEPAFAGSARDGHRHERPA